MRKFYRCFAEKIGWRRGESWGEAATWSQGKWESTRTQRTFDTFTDPTRCRPPSALVHSRPHISALEHLKGHITLEASWKRGLAECLIQPPGNLLKTLFISTLLCTRQWFWSFSTWSVNSLWYVSSRANTIYWTDWGLQPPHTKFPFTENGHWLTGQDGATLHNSKDAVLPGCATQPLAQCPCHPWESGKHI